MVQKNDKQTENDKDPKTTAGVKAKDKTKTTKPKPTDPLIVPVESDSSKSFPCKQCGELFDNLTGIRAHMKAVHSKKPRNMYKCHYCDAEFRSYLLRSQHTITHFADNKFKCQVCGKSYTSLVGLERHFNAHTKQKIFICDYCNKEFYHKKSLKQHIQTHSATRVRLLCHLCGVQCSDNAQLRIHTNTVHEKLRPYGCHECGMRFAIKKTLKSHVMRHSGVKPYNCEVCTKQFSVPEYLRKHLKSHQPHLQPHNKRASISTQKIYTCPHCEVKFESRGNYLSHRRSFVHSHFNKEILAKNLKCEYCERIFADKFQYNRHLNLHLGIKKFSCDICDRKFTQKASIIRHLRRHQPSADKQSCTLCLMKVRNMEKHMETHTKKGYRCQYCNKRYSGKNTINRHIRVKHLSIGPHLCWLCSVKFDHPDALKRHIKRCHKGVEVKPTPVEVDLEQIETFKIEKVK